MLQSTSLIKLRLQFCVGTCICMSVLKPVKSNSMITVLERGLLMKRLLYGTTIINCVVDIMI